MSRFTVEEQVMSEIVRVLRVLEYIGPRGDVEKSLLNREVKGEASFGHIRIREAVLGDFPEVLASPQEIPPIPSLSEEEVCNDKGDSDESDVASTVDALLLTDFEDWKMLCEEVVKWSNSMREEAYRWAVREHLSASDNPVSRLECPEHVRELRSLPQKRSPWNTTGG